MTGIIMSVLLIAGAEGGMTPADYVENHATVDTLDRAVHESVDWDSAGIDRGDLNRQSREQNVIVHAVIVFSKRDTTCDIKILTHDPEFNVGPVALLQFGGADEPVKVLSQGELRERLVTELAPDVFLVDVKLDMDAGSYDPNLTQLVVTHFNGFGQVYSGIEFDLK